MKRIFYSCDTTEEIMNSVLDNNPYTPPQATVCSKEERRHCYKSRKKSIRDNEIQCYPLCKRFTIEIREAVRG